MNVMRTLALASREWVSGVWFFLERSGDACCNLSVGKPGPYWHHTAWGWWREGEVVNRNIPPRIKNLLFGGQSQTNPSSLCLCLLLICFFICSFILSMPPRFVCFTDITLFFFHPRHLPLSFSLPCLSLTPPLLLISPSVSPRAFCPHFSPPPLSLIHLLSCCPIS